MTGKRFKADEYYEVWDNDKFLLSFDQIVDLLNELNDENEQLKKDIEYYKTERLALFEYLDKKDDLKLELKVKK